MLLFKKTSHQPFKKKTNHTMTINPMLRFDALYTYKSFFTSLKNNYQNFHHRHATLWLTKNNYQNFHHPNAAI